MHMKRLERRSSAACVFTSLLFIACSLGSGPIGAATDPESTPPAPKKADDATALNEIVVTGLRASLEKSLDIKRDADVVLDSINSLEMGRFPDDDVADSLRHITGVTISRTTGGEGLYVSIRGLAQQYNIVTLNNRILATDDDGRALAFDILPADVISGADVLKSSQASALEGSIGGTVNMRTAHPLDTLGLHSAVRVEGNYNDMSELWGKRGSLFVSNTMVDDTLGVLVGAVFSDAKTRTDSLNYNTYDGSNPGEWPIGSGQPVVAECCISFGSVFDNKKRYALSGMLEWKPNDQLHLALDGLYAHLSDPQVAYNQAYYPDFNYDQNGNPEWSNVTVKNGLITGFTANTFTPEIVNQTIDRRVTNTLVGFNAEWTPTSRLTFNADLYHSEANRPEGGNDAFVTAGLESTTPFNQNTITWQNTSNGLPNIAVTLPNGQDYGAALASGSLNNNFWTAHYTGLSGFSIRDKVTGLTLDAGLKFDDSWLRQLKVGVAETLRDKTRDDISNDWTGGSSQYDFYTTPPGATPITFGSLGGNVISITNFPNYMQGAGGSFPHTIAVFNIPAMLSALRSLNGQPNTYAGGTYDFSATLPQFNAVNSYKVKENTTAGYFEATFGGEKWAGNAGVRIVHTTTTASTAVDNIESVTIANTSNPTDSAAVVYSDPTPTTSKGSYTYAMPSLNLTYRIDPTLQARFGASETLTRPELNQLAPTRTDNSLNRVYEADYSGNSQLKPIRAYSVDLSLEWYYQKRSALTFAVFGKKIKDFITTQIVNGVDIGVKGFFDGDTQGVPVLYQINQPINGDRGDVYGAELGFQHLFANGFGIHGQYTRTQSKAYVQGAYVGQLEGVAPSSGSLGVLYEAHRIGANVSWDYDGKSVAQTFTEIDGMSAIQSSFSWVTAQLSYEIAPGFKVYAEGKNLANSIARTYLGGRSDAVWAFGAPATGTSSSVGQGYSAFGRTFTFGASYHF
jgi:iron complex outermembrane receptor protein